MIQKLTDVPGGSQSVFVNPLKSFSWRDLVKTLKGAGIAAAAAIATYYGGLAETGGEGAMYFVLIATGINFVLKLFDNTETTQTK